MVVCWEIMCLLLGWVGVGKRKKNVGFLDIRRCFYRFRDEMCFLVYDRSCCLFVEVEVLVRRGFRF